MRSRVLIALVPMLLWASGCATNATGFGDLGLSDGGDEGAPSGSMAGGDAGISPGMSRGEAGAVPEASTPSTEGGFAHEAGGGSPGTPTTLMLGLSMMNLMVNGQSRSAALYVPAGATSTAPLVIALHGDGDIDTNFIATSGLRTLADTQAFVLLAPQGITRDVTVQGQTVPQVDWDAYNSVATGNIDLPFLEQLRAQLQGTRQVDPNKSFVFGYSQGGYMAFLYGLTDATVLSCAGVIAASSPYGGGANDPIIAGATRKIAVAMQIGTLDPAFGAAQTTQATLQADGFPLQFAAINGAGHVPIPGDISMPLNYCLGQSL